MSKNLAKIDSAGEIRFMKIADLSNKGLIFELLGSGLAEFYPALEPFTLDDVKKLLKERTGKEVENVGEWVEWYMNVYQPKHNQGVLTAEENVAMLKELYDMRKEINAKLIKLGRKGLDDREL
jgi:hypothetical protein